MCTDNNRLPYHDPLGQGVQKESHEPEHSLGKTPVTESSERKKPAACKTRLSARFPELIDLVMEDGRIRYLIEESGKLITRAFYIDASERRLEPPDQQAIPFSVAEAKEVLSRYGSSNHDLYWETLNRLKGVSMLPSQEHYHLVTIYVFFTYLPEAVSHYPYLWFFGLPERGKSRILEAVINLSYRGFHTETLNEAYMFRFAENFQGTLGIDVYELTGRAKQRGSYDLLLGRHKTGMKVPRVIAYDKGSFRDTVYYDVAGPTVLATNVEIPVQDPLHSRCIQIVMPEARGKYPNNNTSDELADLRAGLLAFRARHLGEVLQETEKPVPGRLGDITHPLVSVAQLLPAEASTNLLTLIDTLESQRKEDHAETLPGKIAKALYDLRDEAVTGKLPVMRLRQKLNEDGQTFYSAQVIGRELTALGIRRRKTMGTKHIIWNQEMMEAIWKRYGILDD